MIRKINDTFNDAKSDADLYFDLAEQKRFYRLFRKNSVLPKDFEKIANNSGLTTKKFHLRGLQFGNWLSTEDKFDYLSIFYISMIDLNRVLKFKNNNLGMDQMLGVCFGSRGVPKAKAHFHPGQMVINLARYWDKDKFLIETSKMTRFIHTGGAGSLAHEYGHFLDGLFGARLEPSLDFYLTGLRSSVNWNLERPNARKYPMRAQMRKVLDTALINEKTKSGKTPYGDRLKAQPINADYYCSNVEVWARLFEMYICYKLKRSNIQNSFLTKKPEVYDKESVYPTWKEFPPIAREIDKLIVMFRSKVK